MTHFNEHALEMAIMELFEQEGYIYTDGEQVHKEQSDVLLRDDLAIELAMCSLRQLLVYESAVGFSAADGGNLTSHTSPS